MKKEIIEEKYRAACGISDDYKFTTDEEYLINEIFKAYNKWQKLPIPDVVGRSEQFVCKCGLDKLKKSVGFSCTRTDCDMFISN